ncbi:MAG: peptide chain release factor N(5)-glutamine methyltransferase [Rhodospirillales bacterium]|nr:peptide chain release factor N(5)-glutamine methyltransferase [Rhodospirillales bacterium]
MSEDRALLADAATQLAAVGIEAPAREARLLLAHARAHDPQAFPALLARRLSHEPLAYILGTREFWSLDFAVSPATLIPRPDSETLIEAALAARPAGAIRRILDLGTGTGCLLLAALSECRAAFGVGVDRSPAAAALAAANAAALGLAPRSAFLAGDWGAALAGRFDLILCNPPYIERAVIPTLMRDIAQFEPASALDGGEDGLDAYRAVIAGLAPLLDADGIAVLELGQGQAGTVAALAAAAGFTTTVRPDLAGIPRALVLAAATKKPFGSAGGAD